MSTINLLPDDYIQRRREHRANIMCLCLFVVVMAGVLGAWAASEIRRGHTQEVRDRVNASYAEALKRIEQMQQLQIRKARMLAKARDAAELIERVPRSYLLSQVTNALPEGASLLEFRLYPKEVQPAEPTTPRGTKFAKARAARTEPARQVLVKIDVTGQAATDVQVAQFMANLLRHPLLESVELDYSEQKLLDEVAVREFTITMTVKPNVDVVDVLPAAPHAVRPAVDNQEEDDS